MPNTELTLYQLSLEGVMIRDLLEANEGEITPEIEERLDALMLAGPDRVEAAAMVVKGMEASADACASEAERLAKRANGFHSQATYLKSRIAMALDCAFNGKIKTDKFTCYTQAAPAHIEFGIMDGHTIDEIENSDSSCVRVKKELNRVRLKELFEADDPLPTGITFERTPEKRSVRIR